LISESFFAVLMKKTDLKSLSVAELQERIRDEKAILQKLRFTQVVSAVENPMRIRETRREVARTMTELNARLRQTPNA